MALLLVCPFLGRISHAGAQILTGLSDEAWSPPGRMWGTPAPASCHADPSYPCRGVGWRWVAVRPCSSRNRSRVSPVDRVGTGASEVPQGSCRAALRAPSGKVTGGHTGTAGGPSLSIGLALRALRALGCGKAAPSGSRGESRDSGWARPAWSHIPRLQPRAALFQCDAPRRQASPFSSTLFACFGAG